jgi:hypothetical protein
MSGSMSKPAHVVIAGTRRSWTREQRQAILTEARNALTTISAVARRHGLTPNLVFRRRREALDAERAAALPPQPPFVPLSLPGPISTASCGTWRLPARRHDPTRPHNARSLGKEVEVSYPFHPLFQHSAVVVADQLRNGSRHLTLRAREGATFLVPAWMLDAGSRWSRSSIFLAFRSRGF